MKPNFIVFKEVGGRIIPAEVRTLEANYIVVPGKPLVDNANCYYLKEVKESQLKIIKSSSMLWWAAGGAKKRKGFNRNRRISLPAEFTCGNYPMDIFDWGHELYPHFMELSEDDKGLMPVRFFVGNIGWFNARYCKRDKQYYFSQDKERIEHEKNCTYWTCPTIDPLDCDWDCSCSFYKFFTEHEHNKWWGDWLAGIIPYLLYKDRVRVLPKEFTCSDKDKPASILNWAIEADCVFCEACDDWLPATWLEPCEHLT
ncbi:MAG: hypothetical protein GY928_33800 [Colwellia sp.]|nr:hypothetical protein [Colwellia sp.]